MNKNLGRVGAKIVFYILAVILVAWTASLTYGFIQSALPTMQWYVPAFGLVVFDVGMLAWMVVFLNFAEGDWQRVTSIGLTVFDLIGVGLMVMAEILLSGQTWTTPPEMLGTFAIWGIGIWTITNVAGIIVFHLMSPEARASMALQSNRDAIFNTALEQLNQKRQQDGARLAEHLSTKMMNDLMEELSIDRNRDGIPDTYQTRGPVVRDAPKPEISNTQQARIGETRVRPAFAVDTDDPNRPPRMPPIQTRTITVTSNPQRFDDDDEEDEETVVVDDDAVRSNGFPNFAVPTRENTEYCLQCGKRLTGRQKYWCSDACKQRNHRRENV